MRGQQNRTLSVKQFFKRNGRRIAVFTCAIYLFHIVAPVYYAKLQAELYMRVSGRVVDKETGEGVEKAFVGILEIKNGQPTANKDFAKTNKDGMYIFNMVPPGEYSLFVFPPRNGTYSIDLTQKKIEVARGKNVVKLGFELEKGGSISGTVYDADGVTKLRFTQVQAISESGFGISETDENGNYTITNLKPGDPYFVRAMPNGYAVSNRENISVVGGSVTQDVNLILNPNKSTSVSGYVKSISGDPITNSLIAVFFSKDGGISRTNTNGRFQIAGLKPGNYEVLVIAKGYKAISSEVTISESQQINEDFILQPETEELSQTLSNYTLTSSVFAHPPDSCVPRDPLPLDFRLHNDCINACAGMHAAYCGIALAIGISVAAAAFFLPAHPIGLLIGLAVAVSIIVCIWVTAGCHQECPEPPTPPCK